MYKTHPTVLKFVIKKLIPFATPWLCEAGFSAICIFITKNRNRLEVEADLRLFSDKLSDVLFSTQFCHHKKFFYIAFNLTMRKNVHGSQNFAN